MSATATATTTDFTFTFVAIDGREYPVSVTFLNRLPNVTVVGDIHTGDFKARAATRLHTVLPRMRCIVTVDSTTAPFGSDRSGDLYRSGANLADQLYVALQMRMQ